MRHSLILLALVVAGLGPTTTLAQSEPAASTQPQAASQPATPTQPAAPAVLPPVTAGGSGEKPGSLYLRIQEDDQGKAQSLQTAIVRYRGTKGSPFEGQVVDLVGVVHIGERAYYRELNDRLSKYDVVLYELVAPDGTRIRPEDLQERRSILASMQSGMKDLLHLEYQLELVDYLAANFRHADMSPEEFFEDFERRGDSLLKMAARMMGAGLASQAATGGDAGLLLAIFSEDRPKRMKQAMARQLIDIESVSSGIDDANGENTLIKGRNVKAFKILREELEAGKDTIAVFYGAGHLPDMAERLERDFQMQPVETTWLDAWDLQSNGT